MFQTQNPFLLHQEILQYWINEVDVDGFRIRSASFLFEDADLRDDDVITGCNDVSMTS